MTESDMQRAYERALESAGSAGAQAGIAAASWYFDGNTPESTYRAVLDGIESGDPGVLDTFPTADLSGEWADVPSGPVIVENAINDALYELDLISADGSEALRVDAFSDLCDAYEREYADCAAAEIERAARACLLA